MTFFYQLTTTNFLANYQLTVNPIRTLKDNPNKKNQARRVILRANRTTCTQYRRNTLELLTLYNRRRFLRFVFIFIIVNNQNCAKQLEGYLTSRAELQNRNLRNQGTLHVPQSQNCSGRKTFQIAGSNDWKSLLTKLKKTTGIGSFKFNLFKQLRLRQWR